MERTPGHDPNAFLVEDDKVELWLQQAYMTAVEDKRAETVEYDLGEEWESWNELHQDLLINGLRGLPRGRLKARCCKTYDMAGCADWKCSRRETA